MVDEELDQTDRFIRFTAIGRGSPASHPRAIQPPAAGPCPPLPAPRRAEPDAEEEASADSWSRQTVLTVIAFACVLAASAFMAVGRPEEDGEPGVGVNIPRSAEVDRVTAPRLIRDHGGEGPDTPSRRQDLRHHNASSSGGDDSEDGPGDSTPGASSSGHDQPAADGGQEDGRDGDGAEPLATVDLPVVGTVTVDDPTPAELPGLEPPPVDVPETDLPDASDLQLP